LKIKGFPATNLSKRDQSVQLTAKFDSHGLANKRTEYAASLRFRFRCQHPCLPATVQLMGTTAPHRLLKKDPLDWPRSKISFL